MNTPVETKFTQAQIKWAAGHDWFVKTTADGDIQCNDVQLHADGTITKTQETFNSFQSLRYFAGY